MTHKFGTSDYNQEEYNLAFRHMNASMKLHLERGDKYQVTNIEQSLKTVIWNNRNMNFTRPNFELLNHI